MTIYDAPRLRRLRSSMLNWLIVKMDSYQSQFVGNSELATLCT
jgi:hypothetical protein